MLETFLATFLGVILSFLLWLAGESILQSQKDKKALEKLVQEISDEIRMNIIILDAFICSIESSLSKQRVPLLGARLSSVAYECIVSSGELRLITDSNLQTLIRYTAYLTEGFNHFSDNTELNLALFNLKEKSVALNSATERLKNLEDDAKDTKANLQKTLNEMQGIKLPRRITLKFGNLRADLRV
jgi:hypothetical protein